MTPAVFVLTAYSWGCGATGLTKAGTHVVPGFTVAADPAVLPLGSEVLIEGLGRRSVHDTGAAIRGNHLDVYVASCTEAREFGVRKDVRVLVVHLPKRQR